MALEHIKTKLKFYDSKRDEIWEVVYRSRKGLTSVEVICDDESFHYYNSIPDSVKSKAKHPNKTQAETVIRLAKKEKKNEES